MATKQQQGGQAKSLEEILQHCYQVRQRHPMLLRRSMLSCWYTTGYEKTQKVVRELEEQKQTEDNVKLPMLFNDPIHGPIELSPLLCDIVNTPEFQRLKDIKQLGAAHYVYPGATHTRFDHSIGVCHIAGEFVRLLQQQIEELHKRSNSTQDGTHTPQPAPEEVHEDGTNLPPLITPKEVLCVQIAALCHDLGHGPFSHMFEHRVVPELNIDGKFKHEVMSIKMFRKMLRDNPKVLAGFLSNGLRITEVYLIEEMIHHEVDEKTQKLYKVAPQYDDKGTIKSAGKKLMGLVPVDGHAHLYQKRFLYEIVANKLSGVDVDKWDYFARDCHYLGIPNDFQWRRCMLLGRVILDPRNKIEYRVGFRKKEVENIYGMFHTRCMLHKRAYQHKTVKAVEQMFSDAIVEVQDVNLISGKTHVHSVKSIVKSVMNENDPTGFLEAMEGYMRLTDSVLSVIMHHQGGEQAQRPEKKKPRVMKGTHSVPITQENKVANATEILRRVEERRLYRMVYKQSFSEDLYIKRELKKKQGQIKKKIFEKISLSPSSTAIKESDIYYELVKISHKSEEKDNPVQDVLFYSKDTPDKALEGPPPVSELLVPKLFTEYELRLYTKKENPNKEDIEAMKNAFIGWLREKKLLESDDSTKV